MKKTDKTAVLPGFMEKNAAATEPMLYVLNTIILSFCIQACLYLASLNFCVTFGELKSKKNQNNMPFNALLFAKSTILAPSIKISGRQNTSFRFIISIFSS